MRGLVQGANPGPRVGLVVSDVDGTLVTTDKVLSARNRAAVLSLARHDIPFTIISSRPPFGLLMLIEPLNFRLPMAAFNGGVLAAPDLTTLERRPLGGEAARTAVKCLEGCGMDVWLFTEEAWHAREPDGIYVQHEVQTVQVPPVIVEAFEPLIDRAITLVGVSTDFDRLTKCAVDATARLGAVATVSRSQPYYLDINAPGSTRAWRFARWRGFAAWIPPRSLPLATWTTTCRCFAKAASASPWEMGAMRRGRRPVP